MNAPISTAANAEPLWVALTSHTEFLLQQAGAEVLLYENCAPEAIQGRNLVVAASAARPGAETAAARRLRGMGASVSTIPTDLLRGSLDLASMIENAATDGMKINLPMLAALAVEAERTKGAATRGLERPPIIALEIGELLAYDFPPMEALFSPWLRKQHLVMVHAWRGVGKTHFALGVAYAVASGGNFLKWKADKPRKVLYVDGEMPGKAMQERIAAIVKSSESEAEPPEGYFRIITPDVQTMTLPDLGTQDGQNEIAPLLEDAELIVVDNLSTLVRSGVENEGESWLPVATWALALRREGRAVLFVHHSGKGGQQRGSSRREDQLDTVINLRQPAGYSPERGALFTVKFEKARGLHGEEVREIEAELTQGVDGAQVWAWREAEGVTLSRVVELKRLGMSDAEIASELGVNRSTVYRARRKAEADGLIEVTNGSRTA